MTWQQKAFAVATSKTFWAGVGLAGLAVYQASQQHYDQAFASAAAALAAWGLRHAIAKQGQGDQQQ